MKKYTSATKNSQPYSNKIPHVEASIVRANGGLSLLYTGCPISKNNRKRSSKYKAESSKMEEHQAN